MIAGLVLFAAVIAYRLLPVLLGVTTIQPEWLPNFSPMAALCLCGAAYLPRRFAIALPFTALFATDVVLNAYLGYSLFTVEFLGKTVAFAVVAAIGWSLRKNARPSVILPAVLGSSVFFYIATNTASWVYDPHYAKTLAGWLQALTTGVPGFKPTWMFHRNTFASDLLFTALFLACIHRSAKTATAPAPSPVEAAV